MSQPEFQDDPLLVPTAAQWAAMSPDQQTETENGIIAALEKESELMGETTVHFSARASASEVLQRYFRARGRKVFIASDLHTLYPGERAFYPDLLVVFDVGNHHRRSWNVFRERKGLDFVLEILSRDTRRNDLVHKMNLYARIEIPEYFLYDPDTLKITGYRLDEASHFYHKIESEGQSVRSSVLGLSVQIDGFKLRFSHPEGLEIPYADELVDALNRKISGKNQVIEDYVRQISEEQEKVQRAEQKTKAAEKQAKEEKKRADDATLELERLRVLLKEKGLEG